jgi:hypothetical protein
MFCYADTVCMYVEPVFRDILLYSCCQHCDDSGVQP